MQGVVALSRDGCSSLVSLASRTLLPAAGVAVPSDHGRLGRRRTVDFARRGLVPGLEYQVRPARITDVERLAAIGLHSIPAAGRGPLDAADLLRQLVYLPNASLLVAEARREIVGGALLVLRPSVVAGGYVGTIDLLVIAPGSDADRVTDLLVGELVRSASNKGCSTVEIALPDDPAGLARLERVGFGPAGQTLRRSLAATAPVARRT